MRPQSTVSELLRENHLEGTQFLLVEGPTDREFYKQWATSIADDIDSRLVVLIPQEVEMQEGQLEEIGLTEGNRQRVIWAATQVQAATVALRCVADRDCGHHVERFKCEALWWTDFPSLESYGYDPATLDVLNAQFLGGRLPEGIDLVRLMKAALIDLYRIRLHNAALPNPAISKGFSAGGWNPAKTVAPDVASRLAEFDSPDFEDPREVAYGHDICEVLFSQFANEIKNGAKVKEVGVLERALMMSMLITKVFDSSRLASKLQAWLIPN